MQPVSSSSLHAKLIDLYKGRIKEDPVKIPYVRVSYIDFNQNGRRDLGEELIYNQKAEALLKHIVFRENDLLQLKKVNTLVFVENNRTNNYLNTIESLIIARRALLASDADPKKNQEYFSKLEILFHAFLNYLKVKNLKPVTPNQYLDYLREFLWSNGNARAENLIHQLDQVIDNQLKYFKDPNTKVGNCLGLTTLFSTLSFRKGIPVEVVQVNDKISFHIFNKFDKKRIENTNYLGINDKQYKTYKVGSVDDLILSLLINTAYEYDKKNNIPKAIEFLNKALEHDPDDGELQNKLATIYLHNGKMDEAIKWYEKAIINEPLRDNSLHNLGVAYLLKKDYLKAIKYIKFAIQVNSKQAEFYSNLGFAYEKINMFQEAYDNYQEALKLDPKLDTAINNMNRLKQKVKIVSRK